MTIRQDVSRLLFFDGEGKRVLDEGGKEDWQLLRLAMEAMREREVANNT